MVHSSLMVHIAQKWSFPVLQYLSKKSEVTPEMNSFSNDVWGLPSSYNYGLFKINIQIVEVFMNSPYSVDIAHFLGKHSISNISKSTIQQDLKDWYHFLSILILYKYMIVYVSVELSCLILIRNNKYSRKIIKTKRKYKKLITANKK